MLCHNLKALSKYSVIIYPKKFHRHGQQNIYNEVHKALVCRFTNHKLIFGLRVIKILDFS